MGSSDSNPKTALPSDAPTKTAPAAPAEPIPAALAKNPDYEVLRELNRGGMGVVYLARNRRMDRLECLKVVNESLLKQAGALERFEREMRSAGKVIHPNIVTAFSALSLDGLIAFAMEYVDGTDLNKLVQAHGPLPVSNACYYINQAAKALQYAHEKGMVHRDIKPGNLMLTRDGKRQVVKVLDFGLAKATSENQLDGGLTGTGQMLGTPQYIAPEQIENAATAGIQADIYSLGCTLYYLLSGSPPFDDKPSLYAILHAHQVEPARPLNEIRPEVPAEVVAIVDKMMAKSPGQRYQQPGEVAQALAPFFKSGIKPIQTSGVPVSQLAPGAAEVNVQQSPRQETKVETQAGNIQARETVVPPSKPAGPAAPNAKSGNPIGTPPVQTLVEQIDLPGFRAAAAGSGRDQPAVSEKKSLSLNAWAWIAAGLLMAALLVGWAGSSFLTNNSTVADKGASTAEREKSAIAKADPADAGSEVSTEPEGEAAAIVSQPDIRQQKSKLKQAKGKAIPAGEFSDGPKGDMPPASVADSNNAIPAGDQPDAVGQPQLPNGIERLIAPFTAKQANAAQKTWSAALGTKVVERNSTGMDLVLIPPGKFRMGGNAFGMGRSQSPAPINPGVGGMESQIEVTLTRAFYLGKTEVTQGQWQSVMGTTPWKGKRGAREGANYPALYISWDDAKTFCQKLGEISNRPYRLPTEAEWEYACRAGTTTRFSFGNDESQAADYAWFARMGSFPGRGNEAAAYEVAQRKPNPFGLFDMHGNVWEMCEDLYSTRLPGGVDPLASSGSNLYRVMRGGCWSGPAAACDSSSRNRVYGRSGSNREGSGEVGFRVALVAAPVTGSAGTAPQTASATDDTPPDETPPSTDDADNTTAASAEDSVQAGSVWKGEWYVTKKLQKRTTRSAPQKVTFTILERSGESFKARFEVDNSPNSVREIQGTIKGRKLTWLAKNVKPVKGSSGIVPGGVASNSNQGLDSSGTINGNRMVITNGYIEPDGLTHVTGTMNLKKE